MTTKVGSGAVDVVRYRARMKRYLQKFRRPPEIPRMHHVIDAERKVMQGRNVGIVTKTAEGAANVVISLEFARLLCQARATEGYNL